MHHTATPAWSTIRRLFVMSLMDFALDRFRSRCRLLDSVKISVHSIHQRLHIISHAFSSFVSSQLTAKQPQKYCKKQAPRENKTNTRRCHTKMEWEK